MTPGTTAPGLQAAYQRALQQGFKHEPAQAATVAILEQLFQRLAHTPKRGWLPWNRKPRAVNGLYLWGGVGRGKTWMMDLFFHSLPMAEKRRFHFHHFMNAIHQQLKRLELQSNPLPQATLAVTGDIRVLCFDEFFVNDIGDAMLLAGVLQTLVDNNITLVATSNVAPDELYRDGLQRARFLPAIELLKTHTQVLEMPSGDDYRLRALDRMNTYLVPHDEQARHQLEQDFTAIASGMSNIGPMRVNDRDINTIRHADCVAWFDFEVLCGGNRSAADYVDLARSCHTVLLSNIPQLGKDQNDPAKRFIHLIDALYDHRVKLIASAAAEPQHLYQGQRLGAEFQRTSSRLIEMRTHEYLAEAHRP